MAEDSKLSVLLIDPDADLAELVVAILSDEGYGITTMTDTSPEVIASAVGRLEPDCVLLDSVGYDFDGWWAEAARLAARHRAVPTVMFTGDMKALAEARADTTDRAQGAQFAAVLGKPFSLDQLLEAVETACGRSEPFDRSPAGDQSRTDALAAELASAGATDVRTGNRREWATFHVGDDERLFQIYWWQMLGVYIVGYYTPDARLALIGQFHDRNAAVGAALGEAAGPAESDGATA